MRAFRTQIKRVSRNSPRIGLGTALKSRGAGTACTFGCPLVAHARPAGNPGRVKGPDSVHVWLDFDVTELQPGAVLQVRDIAVR